MNSSEEKTIAFNEIVKSVLSISESSQSSASSAQQLTGKSVQLLSMSKNLEKDVDLFKV
ncbi:MAG: hypothetical protein JW982_02890 [Spirochaetes bacterium]|nr:hypothetical protein [Spirochaetota bacterium]